ncbi:MAG: hypothetical protein ACR2NR_17845 [Solirubrobacteraceae bacterium]
MLARLKAAGANPHATALVRAVAGSVRCPEPPSADPLGLAAHLDATYRWVCRAQDARPDGGVSGIFDLVRGTWSASYPETTGYTIPTLLSLASVSGDDEAYERALRMADWCSEVQMQDGAVLSGLLGMPRGPAVFNTGQVIFGWVAAYERSGREHYADCARRACDWLVANQSADGAWRANLSMMTTAPVNTYNARCAWAMAYAGRALGEPRFVAAAEQACDWVLTQQNDGGWFHHAGFAVDEVPLLHTISYVIEGLQGVHAFGGDQRYLDAARRAVDAILRRYAAGPVAGRLDAQWRPTVSWRCPTGEAQIAIVLHRLAPHFPDGGYLEAGQRLVAGVAAVQLSLSAGAPLRPGGGPAVGGVPGSYPVWGGYVRFGLPNWAAKFFLDALLQASRGADEHGFPTPLTDMPLR